ncbi:hypothetical protein A3C32_00920 [Candidatus Daviesbacteria bacterium RIFCSPHIGHO2_02_FULL_41_14]|nr:MAG: hypothetical protein A3C32_00920 [Candidatus Daviesbacteria bacterium RIFCSPHIGHO2_02_FULL_41_14]
MTIIHRESFIYLNFLRSFWWLFLSLMLIGGLIGASFAIKQPLQSFTEVQLEAGFELEKMQDNILLADEVVGILRSRSIQAELMISKETKVVAHKNGPLMVNLLVESPSLELASKEATILSNYVVARYGFQVLGTSSGNSSGEMFLMVLIGSGAGLFLGLILSLLKTYLKNY